MSEWQPVIGLEVHAQLKTRTKLFCGCAHEFGGDPNSRTCPICLGLPGALPRPNGEAIRLAVRFALAIDAEVHPISFWARKHYFYPDLPKGYQITQYERPLATLGGIRIEPPGRPPQRVEVSRIHLEEDAGKSVHEGFAAGKSGIDLNRAGVPLVEIVSQPQLRSPDDAYLYLERLKSILRVTSVCDADLERGSLRCDANVSVHRAGDPLAKRVEIKNLNSFRFVRRALQYEIDRQLGLARGGGGVVQETRLWDEAASVTRTLRGKEQAEDYRYFDDPDLRPLVVDAALRARAVQGLPELTHRRRDRYHHGHGLSEIDAHRLAVDHEIADFFDQVTALSGNARAAARWVLGEWLARLNVDGLSPVATPISAAALADLIRAVDQGRLTASGAKQVFAATAGGEGSPEAIIAARGLARQNDPLVADAAIQAVLAAKPELVAQYRAGKVQLLEYLIGQVMKQTGGRGDPSEVREALERALQS